MFWDRFGTHELSGSRRHYDLLQASICLADQATARMDSSIPLASDKPADYGATKAPAQQSMSAPLAVSDKDGFKLYDHNSVKLAGAPWETLTCSQRFVRAVKALFCGLCCIACSPIECCCGALIWLKISILSLIHISEPTRLMSIA